MRLGMGDADELAAPTQQLDEASAGELAFATEPQPWTAPEVVGGRIRWRRLWPGSQGRSVGGFMLSRRDMPDGAVKPAMLRQSM
jgi:hypothetical protein